MPKDTTEPASRQLAGESERGQSRWLPRPLQITPAGGRRADQVASAAVVEQNRPPGPPESIYTISPHRLTSSATTTNIAG